MVTPHFEEPMVDLMSLSWADQRREMLPALTEDVRIDSVELVELPVTPRPRESQREWLNQPFFLRLKLDQFV